MPFAIQLLMKVFIVSVFSNTAVIGKYVLPWCSIYSGKIADQSPDSFAVRMMHISIGQDILVI